MLSSEAQNWYVVAYTLIWILNENFGHAALFTYFSCYTI